MGVFSGLQWPLAALLCTAVYLVYSYMYCGPVKLPPGPRRLTVIGNIHQINGEYQEVTFAQWAKQYGMYNHSSPSSRCSS